MISSFPNWNPRPQPDQAKSSQQSTLGYCCQKIHFHPPPIRDHGGLLEDATFSRLCKQTIMLSLTAPLIRFDGLRTQRHTTLTGLSTTRGGGLSLHACLDLTRHSQEGLFHVTRSFGRCFQKFNPKRIGKFFALFGTDDTFASQITFVADQQFVDILGGIPINFMQPLFDIVERFRIGHIINNNNPMCTTIIRRCNSPETFLSSRIPNLQFDCLSIQFNGTDFLQNQTKAKNKQ